MPKKLRGKREHDLLKRVLAAKKADRFLYREIVGLNEAWRMSSAFDRLEEDGYIERVVERVGVWFWRLTPKGIEAANAKKMPRGNEEKPDEIKIPRRKVNWKPTKIYAQIKAKRAKEKLGLE